MLAFKKSNYSGLSPRIQTEIRRKWEYGIYINGFYNF